MPIAIKNSGLTADDVDALYVKNAGIIADQIDKVFVFQTQVFPAASGVATATLSVAGNIRTGNGTYASTQFATSGSGSGATFDVVITSRTATSFSVTGAGTGYAVGDTITLQIGSVSSTFQNPRVELTVASLG